MGLSSRFGTWWRAVTRRGELETQLDEELRFHVESYAEDLMRTGTPREEAIRRARAELGSAGGGSREFPAGLGHALLR